MSESLKFIFSLSILFPAVASIFRYRNADASYRPFLIWIFISVLNELWVGLYIGDSRDLSILNWHLFMLVECLILLIQFYYWGRFKKALYLFYLLLLLTVAGWLYENFIYSSIYVYNSGFLIAYSFVLVLLSINTINIIVAQHNQMLYKNGQFIICVAMIIFFIYQIFVFLFLAMDIRDNKLLVKIFDIRVYINAFTNILYAIGIYYIPERGVHDAFFKKQQKKNML